MPSAAGGTKQRGSGIWAALCAGRFVAIVACLTAPQAMGQTGAPPSSTRVPPPADRGGNRGRSVEGTIAEGASTREAKLAAVGAIPFDQMTPEAVQRLRSVMEDASYFRRMPTQTVACDPEMYTFLVRHPEVVVSLWDVMGITKVSLERIGEFQLTGDDGAGTKCKMDLVYGGDSLHVYQSHGVYEGNMWARELRGHCVVAIHNRPTQLADGRSGMIAWMDAFMKLENVGADIVVKTLGPLVGKTADHNFIECTNFFSQISQTASTNPDGLEHVADRLSRVAPQVRKEFVQTSYSVARKNSPPRGPISSASSAQPRSGWETIPGR